MELLELLERKRNRNSNKRSGLQLSWKINFMNPELDTKMKAGLSIVLQKIRDKLPDLGLGIGL